MEFEGQYLTYTEYKLIGGSLEIMPFNLLEFEARMILDKRTQRRLNQIDNIPFEVKMCIYKMVNTLASYIIEIEKEKNTTYNKNVASESIDGYSVSYITMDQVLEKAQGIIKSKQSELEDIISNYLTNTIINGVPILYLGVI